MNRSLEKAFQILYFVADHQGQMGLSDISRAMNIDKATAFRYLNTLESLQLVEKKTQRFFLGMALFRLGNLVQSKRQIVDAIHPLLQDLCDGVNETVNLATLHDGQVLYLDKIESKRSLQIQSTVGGTVPLHCTALGKSILSILPDSQVDPLLERLRLERKTAKTIMDMAVLRQQIGQIKRRGFSTDLEEYEEGLTCVAVPISFEHLGFLGGISLSGPSFRFTAAAVRSLAKRLQHTAVETATMLSQPARG